MPGMPSPEHVCKASALKAQMWNAHARDRATSGADLAEEAFRDPRKLRLAIGSWQHSPGSGPERPRQQSKR